MGQSLNKKVAAYFVDWVAVQRAIAPRRTSAILQEIWGETSAPVIARSRRVFSFDLVGRTLDAFCCHSTFGEWVDEALGNRFSLPLYFFEIARADPARKALRYPRRMVRKEVHSKLSLDKYDFPLEDAPKYIPPRLVLDLSWHVLRTSKNPNHKLTAFGHLFTQARRRGNACVAASLALHALELLSSSDDWTQARFFQRLHYLPLVRLEAGPCSALLELSRTYFGDDVHSIGNTFAHSSIFHLTMGAPQQAKSDALIARLLIPQSDVMYHLDLHYLLARVALLDSDNGTAQRHLRAFEILIPNAPEPQLPAIYHTHRFLEALLWMARSEFRDALEAIDSLLAVESPNLSFRVSLLLHRAVCASNLDRQGILIETLEDLRLLSIMRPVDLPAYFWAVVEEALQVRKQRAARFAELAARLLQPGKRTGPDQPPGSKEP